MAPCGQTSTQRPQPRHASPMSARSRSWIWHHKADALGAGAAADTPAAHGHVDTGHARDLGAYLRCKVWQHGPQAAAGQQLQMVNSRPLGRPPTRPYRAVAADHVDQAGLPAAPFIAPSASSFVTGRPSFGLIPAAASPGTGSPSRWDSPCTWCHHDRCRFHDPMGMCLFDKVLHDLGRQHHLAGQIDRRVDLNHPVLGQIDQVNLRQRTTGPVSYQERHLVARAPESDLETPS